MERLVKTCDKLCLVPVFGWGEVGLPLIQPATDFGRRWHTSCSAHRSGVPCLCITVIAEFASVEAVTRFGAKMLTGPADKSIFWREEHGS